jgi:hypothetical protein
MIQYPETVVRVMRPQIVNLRAAVAHHFKHRHDGRGSVAVRNWIQALRKTDRASGYSDALRQMQGARA